MTLLTTSKREIASSKTFGIYKSKSVPSHNISTVSKKRLDASTMKIKVLWDGIQYLKIAATLLTGLGQI